MKQLTVGKELETPRRTVWWRPGLVQGRKLRNSRAFSVLLKVGVHIREGSIAPRFCWAEQASDRVIAIGHKDYRFAGSDAGGRPAAALYSLIESAKLNGLNPQHYLADVLARIADNPARRIAELLLWSWQPLDANRAAA